MTDVRDTVIITGAGASHGARPGNRQPPLGRRLAEYLLRWFDANAPAETDDWQRNHAMSYELDHSAPPESLFDGDPDVRSVLKQAADRSLRSETGFEETMSELLRDQNRAMLERVNDVLALAMLCGRDCAFLTQEDRYDELFTLLAPRLRGLVTLNYDLLAEEALERCGLTFRYRDTDGGADVTIDKVHGSVNRFQPSGVGSGATVEIARTHTKPLRAVEQTSMLSFYNDHPAYAPSTNSHANAVIELKRGRMPLVMVTYAPGKDAMHGRPHLDRIRNECFADLRKKPPKRIIAIGLSPPRGNGDDDTWEAFCQLLANLDSAKEYWSGVADERDRMTQYGFQGRSGRLDDLISDSRKTA